MKSKKESKENKQEEVKEEKKAEETIKQEENKVEDISKEEGLSEIDKLKEALEEKQKQADEYKAEYLRSVAEYQTLRNRIEKEKSEYINYGKAKILDRNIGIYDIFEQAMISVRAGQDIKSIKIGLDMIYNEFSKMLKEEGVEKIDCLNKKFDPNICEALEQVEDDTVEEGIILAIYQNGYKLNGKLMRPARVKVAKKKSKEQPSSDEKDE